MGDLNPGYTFGWGDVVTPDTLNQLVSGATIKPASITTSHLAPGCINDPSLVGESFTLNITKLRGFVEGAVLVGNTDTTASAYTFSSEFSLSSNTISLADGAVNESKIADNAVSTSKIKNNAVTVDKLDKYFQSSQSIKLPFALTIDASGRISAVRNISETTINVSLPNQGQQSVVTVATVNYEPVYVRIAILHTYNNVTYHLPPETLYISGGSLHTIPLLAYVENSGSSYAIKVLLYRYDNQSFNLKVPYQVNPIIPTSPVTVKVWYG